MVGLTVDLVNDEVRSVYCLTEDGKVLHGWAKPDDPNCLYRWLFDAEGGDE